MTPSRPNQFLYCTKVDTGCKCGGPCIIMSREPAQLLQIGGVLGHAVETRGYMGSMCLTGYSEQDIRNFTLRLFFKQSCIIAKDQTEAQ